MNPSRSAYKSLIIGCGAAMLAEKVIFLIILLFQELMYLFLSISRHQQAFSVFQDMKSAGRLMVRLQLQNFELSFGYASRRRKKSKYRFYFEGEVVQNIREQKGEKNNNNM